MSNNRGKYGYNQSTLNTGCKPRNSGMLSSKELSPTTLVNHTRVGEPYSGAQRGAPSVDVTKLYRPHGTCMAPDVDHDTTCTWHWLCPIYHELLVDVLNVLNEVVSPASFRLGMS